MKTPNLELSELSEAESPAFENQNDAFWALDAVVQLTVRDKDINIPPTSSAQQGDRYIVPITPEPAAEWVGHARHIAYFTVEGWRFRNPRQGWLAWVQDEDTLYRYTGLAWEAVSFGGGSVTGAANLGAGVGLFLDLAASVLRFKSLIAGANISLGDSGTEVTISASVPQQRPPRLIYANTTIPNDNQVVATAIETEFGSSYEIPGGSPERIVPGSVLWVHLAGLYGTLAGSPTSSLRIRVKIGGVTVWDTGPVLLLQGLSGMRWEADCIGIVHFTGGSGQIEAQGWARFATDDHGGAFEVPMKNTDQVLVDTLSNIEITATAHWNVNASDNSVQLRQMLIELEDAENIDPAPVIAGDIAVVGTPARQAFGDPSPVVLTRPLGVEENDLLLVCLALESNSAGSWPTITPPTGFTSVAQVTTSGSGFYQLNVFAKVAGSAEPGSYSFAFSGVALFATVSDAAIAAFEGVDPGDPIEDVQTQVNTPASNNVTAPAVTSLGTDRVLISIYGGTDGSGAGDVINQPGGQTVLTKKTTGAFAWLTWAYEDINAAGSTGTRVATYGSGSALSGAVSLLLKPGA